MVRLTENQHWLLYSARSGMAPPEPVAQARETGVYRRKYTELLFELWKSHNKLATHREGAKALEVLAIFYAKLLGVVLQHWILLSTTWSMESRSLFKAVRAVADMVKQIRMALGDSAALQAVLLKLRDVIEKLGGTTDRITNPSHAQLLNNPELLDWLLHEDCVEQ